MVWSADDVAGGLYITTPYNADFVRDLMSYSRSRKYLGVGGPIYWDSREQAWFINDTDWRNVRDIVIFYFGELLSDVVDLSLFEE